MKFFKTLAVIGSLGYAIMGHSLLAQTTAASTAVTPPVVVEPNKDPDRIPDDIKALIKKFEAQRDAYLDEQRILLAKLKNATTAAQREAIRDQLQENRTDFLAELRDFREDLRQEIRELKGKLNNQELRRLIDAVKDTVDGHHGRK
jgi:hypothetical protein